MHRRLRKARIQARHAILAFAPLTAAYLVAAGRVSVGGSLDLLWLLLTVAAVMHCLQQRVSGASRVPQLLSLALVLALFFPMVSLDDEYAQELLPGELQSLLCPPAKQRQTHQSCALDAPSLAAAPQFTFRLHCPAECVASDRPTVRACAWSQASGNHSPPLA
ncbi:MAG TPA: hypothetical protein VMS96_13050 [Terriglobales bacterium]|nr:hypothetical protein [Terriglobales bacterium]